MRAKVLLLCAAAVLAAGCDYTVPLVTTPNTAIDMSLVGLWEQQDVTGTPPRLLVLPLGRYEHLVVYPVGSDNAMFARACLWQGDGAPLVQLDWFGTGKGKTPDDARTYQYAAWTLATNTLTVSLLDPQVVSGSIASSNALAQAVLANGGNPAGFRAPMRFRGLERDRAPSANR